MTPPDYSTSRTDESFEIIALNAHHSQFVAQGAVTDAKPGLAAGTLLMVQDRDGWLTLHRVEGVIIDARGERVAFGPRIPWPDGSIAARQSGSRPS